MKIPTKVKNEIQWGDLRRAVMSKRSGLYKVRNRAISSEISASAHEGIAACNWFLEQIKIVRQ